MKRAAFIPSRRSTRAVALVASASSGRWASRRAATRSATPRAPAIGSAARSSSSRAAAAATSLADAGTAGSIGPNLDYAFVQSRIDGLGEDTIQQVVRGQIAYPVVDPPTDAPGMPADIFEGQDAEDVASYVASVAGLDANGEPIDPANPPKPKPPAGGETDGNAIFASAGCGGCHTFADAGSNGQVGPNLDQSKPTLELALDRITNGQGGMPAFKGQLSDEQIQAVAEYVSGG